MNIYVGNLSYKATEASLKTAFAQYGEVLSVKIITDKLTEKPRGFAFVVMADQASGEKAVSAMNGKEFEGRSLRVNEARPREERSESRRPREEGSSRGQRFSNRY